MKGQEAQGGAASFRDAEAAARRALELDPDLVAASRLLITMTTERGELVVAYRAARDLVDRRPDSAEAHFSLSYVLRYAGLLSEAARECELARSIDPTNAGHRSCAIVFLLASDLQRAREFNRLDEGSNWNANLSMFILLREGRPAEAIELGRRRKVTSPYWPLIQACHDKRPEGEIRTVAATMEKELREVGDPENIYWAAGLLAECEQRKQALEMLRFAVDQNFCAYPGLETDPAFISIRDDPEFDQIRKMAMDCQARFIAARAQIR